MDNIAATTAPRQPTLNDIPIEVTVSVGHARPTIKELLALENDTIFGLDRKVNDPVELFVGERLIARGHLEVMTNDGVDQLAVRISEIVPNSPDLGA